MRIYLLKIYGRKYYKIAGSANDAKKKLIKEEYKGHDIPLSHVHLIKSLKG